MNSEEQSINARIALLYKELRLSSSDFAKALGVQPAVIGNIVGGRMSKPSFGLLEQIANAFPQARMEWLIRGKGSILTVSDAADAECRDELRRLQNKFNDLEEDHERLQLSFSRLRKLNILLGGPGADDEK